MLNKFLIPEIANDYAAYFQSGIGEKIYKMEKSIIANLIKDIPRTDILELGCGTGHWSNCFTKQGYEVRGIDTSEAILQVAKNKNLDIEFQLANSEKIPFLKESFKVISSITMLEFVDDQQKVVKEINRVLQKDGWLILGCLNAKSILGKNNDSGDVFKETKFLTIDLLKNFLKEIGTPRFEMGVYMKEDYSLIDNLSNITTIEPVFIGCIVQKR